MPRRTTHVPLKPLAAAKLSACFVQIAPLNNTPLVTLVPSVIVKDTIIDGASDDQDQWPNKASGGKLGSPQQCPPKYGFGFDDDLIQIRASQKGERREVIA